MPEPKITKAQTRALCLSVSQPVRVKTPGGTSKFDGAENFFQRVTIHTLIKIGYLMPTQAFNAYAPTESGIARTVELAKVKPRKRKKKNENQPA